MYFSLEDIRSSLPRLKKVNPFFGTCYLAFKRERVPVGDLRQLVFAQVNRAFLEEFYRPLKTDKRFYHPFLTSNDGPGWVSGEYARTSLQRIVQDTFRDAVVHRKNSDKYGWSRDYVERLRSHLSAPIPAFELAVWLYRTRDWPSAISPGQILDTFFREFYVSPREIDALFDTSVPQVRPGWLSAQPLADTVLIEVIGPPPGTRADSAAKLLGLRLEHVGPARQFSYDPAERLNLLTGDNSLGKTFLLECMWWALTGEWIGLPAMPRTDASKRAPKIVFTLSTDNRARTRESTYDWDRQTWTAPKRDEHPGLAIYARFDGSFAVWDPARRSLRETGSKATQRHQIVLDKTEIWEGKTGDGSTKSEWICNGMIRDWVSWQTGGKRHEDRWNALTACLRRLSPSVEETLTPAEPTRVAFESREIPTLRLPYGDVPMYHASAGVQRIVAIAYVLVWAWHEHIAYSVMARREPQRRLTLIIDEIEAHLHPRWQRVIVPAVVDASSALSDGAVSQIHVATHSPMVLASAEPLFDSTCDGLHHLRLQGSEVILEPLPFVRRGRVDLWLTSPVFGLAQARSLDAERAIAMAVALQRGDRPTKSAVKEANQALVRSLAPDDGFWPRWRHFALSHGLE